MIVCGIEDSVFSIQFPRRKGERCSFIPFLRNSELCFLYFQRFSIFVVLKPSFGAERLLSNSLRYVMVFPNMEIEMVCGVVPFGTCKLIHCSPCLFVFYRLITIYCSSVLPESFGYVMYDCCHCQLYVPYNIC